MNKQRSRDFAEFMQALMDFEAYVVLDDFVGMFGKEKGMALWQDFKNKCASSTTLFYRILDNKERKVFNDYLDKSRWLESERSRLD
ncbi:MAG: hypothetical protein MUE85_13285 [Microscillaceae bacterium]|jgi:hypothetical protein|nr:hypothetical protein [Microscillaceae bacterium]